jgi:hypothetical protein
VLSSILCQICLDLWDTHILSSVVEVQLPYFAFGKLGFIFSYCSSGQFIKRVAIDNYNLLSSVAF